MTRKIIELNRNDLYEKVWKEPMTHLAKKYGISDVGLRKICRKLNVPTPPLGYWAKLQFGKKVVHPSLPKLKYGEKETYTLHIQPDSKKCMEVDPCVEEFITQVVAAAPINVSERLIDPHPLVKLTRDVLMNNKPGPGSRGVLRFWNEKALDIRVTPDSLKRALRIMDAVVKAFEERNFSVEVDAAKNYETHVLIQDEKLRVSLVEKIRQIDHELTDEEKKNPRASMWAHRYDYKPTGILTLRIDEWGASGMQKSWSDGKKKLEDKLNDFVVGAVKFAVVQREERIKREKEWEERRKKEEEERQRRLFIENFIFNLEKDAESWAKTQMLRSFIQEVEKKVAQRLDKHIFQQKYEKWLSMANQYIDQVDPFKRGLPFENMSCE